MKTSSWIIMGVVAVIMVIGQSSFADPHRLGVGVKYNAGVEDMIDNFDSDGLSYLISYQLVPLSLLKLEAELEIQPPIETPAGDTETVFTPQAYLLLGSIIYAGLGIGLPYSDGEFADDPVYNIKAGLDVPFGPIHVDLNANYGFLEFDDLSDFDEDFICLALAVRYEF